jgi:hypothetical protein
VASVFVASTNNFNGPEMVANNLPAAWFPDTYVRYATVFEKLMRQTSADAVDLDFTKALWSSNDWYDATTKTWNTVPVPNDPNDFNTCFVPGNLCEGAEYQAIQYPADKTAYLQLGNPQAPQSPITGRMTRSRLESTPSGSWRPPSLRWPAQCRVMP